MKFYYLMIILCCLSCDQHKSNVQISSPAESLRTIREDLNYPWEILWGKDNFIWMTERGGKISKIDPETGRTVFYTKLTNVVSNNEGGMLGMVQHPDFLRNGLMYVVYDYRDGSGNYREKMIQVKFENERIAVVKTLIDNIPAATIHNGSRLVISPDSKLFMTTGDASYADNAQSLNSISGKVLRFNLDGSVPSDNPFPNSFIWSFGHRNPQGMVMVKGILYASEHGPNIEDEVNIIEKKRNYGWPTVNGPCDQADEKAFCAANNVKEPIWSSGSKTIAVCGLDYYNYDLIPQWKNCLLMLTLKDASLRSLQLNADGTGISNQQTWLKNRFGRLRDICISPSGKVYVCSSNGSNSDVLVEINKL